MASPTRLAEHLERFWASPTRLAEQLERFWASPTRLAEQLERFWASPTRDLGPTDGVSPLACRANLPFLGHRAYIAPMCVTFFESQLSHTILYAAETELDGRTVHVMGYQNRAKNLAKGPNAMLLPIPAAKALGSDNMLDARDFSGILESYEKSYDRFVRRRTDWEYLAKSAEPQAAKPKVEVFDRGSFTVVLARDARLIPEALARVPQHRRPRPNQAIFSAYAQYYPGWHVALCCYDGSLQAEPMLFWYEPLFPGNLFAPALDAHDGNPPDIHARVRRDHYVFFASKKSIRGMPLRPTHVLDRIPEQYRSLFVPHFAGVEMNGLGENGDFWVDVRDLDEYNTYMDTRLPPGATG